MVVQKVCACYFLFLQQTIAFQKLWKMLFISSKKLFLFLRNFCKLFALASVIFKITQKPLYVISENLVRCYIVITGTFFNFFEALRWSSFKISWLFTKIKKGPGTSFWYTFSEWKCSLFITLSIGKVSMSYLFSFWRYQTNCIKFLFRQFMTS